MTRTYILKEPIPEWLYPFSMDLRDCDILTCPMRIPLMTWRSRLETKKDEFRPADEEERHRRQMVLRSGWIKP
jgi:hypothetical protein